MLTKKVLNVFAVATFMLSGSVFAGPLDDGINECGVPVCDISATVEALTSLNEDRRYNYVNKMLRTYGDSSELEILKNLLATSKETKAISVAQEDADWVIRESNSLTNAMIMGLAKHSEIDATELSLYFTQITSAQKRYEIIEFWSKKVDSIESIEDLSALVTFSQSAKAHSIMLGDEAWIPRAAGSLVSKITIKLTALDPAHEGIYSVDSMITGVTQGILPFDKIAVLDSSAEESLVVIFYNSQYRRASFTFSDVALAGNILSGKSISSSQTSKEFSFELDRETGAISGMLSTTDSTISFSGTQTFSTRSVFAGQTPIILTENDAIGTFNGNVGSMKVSLTVKSFLPGVYSATLRNESGSVKKDYKGKFYPKNGVLSLTNNSTMKLIVSLREIDGEMVWSGYSYSVKRPTAVEATFTK
jgi:hypothetical protein